MDTDESLVVAYRLGQEDALTFLIERYVRPIYSFCYRFVQSAAEAEDLVQETFIKVWRRIDTFKEGSLFKPWIFAIARNTTLDYLRKKKIPVVSDFDRNGANVLEDTIASDELLPDELLIARQSADVIERALLNIAPLYREVLLLRFQEEMTFDEIGTVIGKPLNTVKSQYRRGIIQLQKILQTDALHQNKPSYRTTTRE